MENRNNKEIKREYKKLGNPGPVIDTQRITLRGYMTRHSINSYQIATELRIKRAL